MNRATPISADEFHELITDISEVCQGLRAAHVIILPERLHGRCHIHFFKDKPRHQCRGGIQVHDPVGIDNQRSVTVRIKAQVDARSLLSAIETVMEYTG